MEFKCKNCNSTKYRQISSQVKQCEECGMLTQSKGVVDPKVLDCTEEKDKTKQKEKEEFDAEFIKIIRSNPYRICQRIRPDGMIEYYPIPWDNF